MEREWLPPPGLRAASGKLVINFGAILKHSGRRSAGERPWGHTLRHHCACSDNRAFANRNSWQDCDSCTYPGVILDRDALADVSKLRRLPVVLSGPDVHGCGEINVTADTETSPAVQNGTIANDGSLTDLNLSGIAELKAVIDDRPFSKLSPPG